MSGGDASAAADGEKGNDSLSFVVIEGRGSAWVVHGSTWGWVYGCRRGRKRESLDQGVLQNWV